MPMPRPPAGGIPCLSAADEVVVHLGHRILLLLARELVAEELLLEVRVVELGVGVGQLDAADVQLEAFGDGRVGRLALGQRADGGRVVDDEDRAGELVLDDGLEQLAHDDVGVLARGGDAGGLGAGLDGGRIGRVDPGVLGQQLGIGPPGPGGREVDGRLAPGADEPAAERLDRAADEGLGQVHHRVVVAIGLVGLEHRELGVMPRAEPLVAINPADLEDPFHPADQEPLQVQLGRDPQEQVDVQRVVMGDERPGRRPAGDRLHRGRLDLDEAPLGHGLAERRDDLRPAQEGGQRLGVAEQVDVPLPVSLFLVGQPVPLLGRREQALGQEGERLGEDGQLAGAGIAEASVDADDVAEVEQFGQLPPLFADLLLADHDLDAPDQSPIWRKLTFPWPRRSMIRPATRTIGPGG